MRANLNWLAKEICKIEGKKKQADIAQVKEVLLAFGCVLYAVDIYTSQELWLKLLEAGEKKCKKELKK